MNDAIGPFGGDCCARQIELYLAEEVVARLKQEIILSVHRRGATDDAIFIVDFNGKACLRGHDAHEKRFIPDWIEIFLHCCRLCATYWPRVAEALRIINGEHVDNGIWITANNVRLKACQGYYNSFLTLLIMLLRQTWHQKCPSS